MKNILALTLVLALSNLPLSFVEAAKTPTTAIKASAQKQALIKKSIASYRGNCPCPWSTMKNGRTCGKTSAWSKPRGAQPLCYEWEIK